MEKQVWEPNCSSHNDFKKRHKKKFLTHFPMYRIDAQQQWCDNNCNTVYGGGVIRSVGSIWQSGSVYSLIETPITQCYHKS